LINLNLLPGADVYELITYLSKFKKIRSVMLVGHEPLLGSLVSTLLCQPDGSISIKKGACVALDVHFSKNNKANFLWYLKPGNKLISSLEKAFL